MRRGFLHHIELYVSNLQNSYNFWSWFLKEMGYKEHQSWESGFSFKLGPTYIVFVQTENQYLENKYHRKQVGLNHLAFYAESKKDVDELTEKLKEKDVVILYQDKHPHAGGNYAVYFEDPDRIKVEVVAPE